MFSEVLADLPPEVLGDSDGVVTASLHCGVIGHYHALDTTAIIGVGGNS